MHEEITPNSSSITCRRIVSRFAIQSGRYTPTETTSAHSSIQFRLIIPTRSHVSNYNYMKFFHGIECHQHTFACNQFHPWGIQWDAMVVAVLLLEFRLETKDVPQNELRASKIRRRPPYFQKRQITILPPSQRYSSIHIWHHLQQFVLLYTSYSSNHRGKWYMEDEAPSRHCASPVVVLERSFEFSGTFFKWVPPDFKRNQKSRHHRQRAQQHSSSCLDGIITFTTTQSWS